MSSEDSSWQEWAEAYDSKYLGLLEHGNLKLVWPEPGGKVIGTTTLTEYKVTNRVFKKRKVQLMSPPPMEASPPPAPEVSPPQAAVQAEA
jgi:hypothetical protein